jgi:uncharacterized protein YdeI (BOF family)
MSYITADRVKETTTIVGTGTVSLLGTSTGFRTFASQMTVGDTCSYIISNASGSEWESGLATYSAANTLTRTSINSSSNSNNAVVFTGGVKDVFMGPTADSLVDYNPVTGAISNATWSGSTISTSKGGTGSTTASGARTNLGLVIGTDVLAPTGSAASLINFPTLNQNTTGTAANVTGIVAVTNGGTGVTTSTGTGSVVLSNTPTLVTPQTNAINAVPVVSGAGNSLTLTAGSGVTSGAGGSVILKPGAQSVSGGNGYVYIQHTDGNNTYAFTTVDSASQSGLLNASCYSFHIKSTYGMQIQTNFGVNTYSNGVIVKSGVPLCWHTNVSGGFDATTAKVALIDDAQDILAQRRTTNAQAFRVYNTYTDASNYERLGITWASNICTIGVAQAGTGVPRVLNVNANNINAPTLPASATVTAATGNGTTVTYTAANTFSVGQVVSITGLTITTGSSLNLSNQTIITASATQFTITNATVGTAAATQAGTATIQSAGNSVTITAGNASGTGAGGSLILQAGLQATSGGDGKVIVKQASGQTSNIFEVQNSSGTTYESTYIASSVVYKDISTNGSSAPLARLYAGSSEAALFLNGSGRTIKLTANNDVPNLTFTGFGQPVTFYNGSSGTTSFLSANASTGVVSFPAGAVFDGSNGAKFGHSSSGQTAPYNYSTVVGSYDPNSGNLYVNALGAGANGIQAGHNAELFWVREGGKPRVFVQSIGSSGTKNGFVGVRTESPLGQLHVVAGMNNKPVMITQAKTTNTVTVTNKQLTSNVATLTYSGTGTFKYGETITVAGVDATFNGTFTVTSATTTTVTYALVAADVASTASSGTITCTQTANLQEWQDSSGTVLAKVSKDGYITSPTIYSQIGGGFFIPTELQGIYFENGTTQIKCYNGYIRFFNAGGSTGSIYIDPGSNGYTGYVSLDASNTFAQRNGTNAQTFRLYNTYTDASNYERLGVNWASNICTIGLEQAGTGSTRNIVLAGANATSGAGGNVTITAGNGSGVGAGGNIILQPGAQGTSGGNGNTIIKASDGSSIATFYSDNTANYYILFSKQVSFAGQIVSNMLMAAGNSFYFRNSAGFNAGGFAGVLTGVLDLWNPASTSEGASLAYPSYTVAISTNQNDYSLKCHVFNRLNCTSACSITGIAPSAAAGSGHRDGRMIRIYNVGTANLTLAHNSASSTAANRMFSSTGADIVLAPNDYAELIYDATSNGSGAAGWRVS